MYSQTSLHEIIVQLELSFSPRVYSINRLSLLFFGKEINNHISVKNVYWLKTFCSFSSFGLNPKEISAEMTIMIAKTTKMEGETTYHTN